MQDYKINLRIKNILLRICSEEGYITISSIAKDLGISAKTVIRDIPEVEEWLKSKGCSLLKKTGAGIRFNGSLEDRNEIVSLLNDEKEETVYSPLDRKYAIIGELLKYQEPVKLYSFTKMLKVTESTISNDLDKAEEWFIKHGLALIRKPGLGVYIEGQEKNIRKAMVDLIYESMDENQLMDLIRHGLSDDTTDDTDVVYSTRLRLMNFIDNGMIKKLRTLVDIIEDNIDNKLADSAYVGLIVHIALTIQRIKQNEKMNMDPNVLKDLKSRQEYLIAQKLGANISGAFGMEIPEEEIGYITMHMVGSKIFNKNQELGKRSIGNFELVKMAREIIKIAENETGSFLEHNEKLLIGLVNHLGPAVSRLKMNLDIRNPLLAEIKTHYPELIRVSEKCVRIVENHFGVKMPESEIAYIAMHIGAALQDNTAVTKHVYRAVIACAAGIGTSRILATRIEKEFDNIQIVDNISTIHIEEDWLYQHDIELIISTVKIENCPIPVVNVNPMIFEEDKIKILNKIRTIENSASKPVGKKKKSLKFKDKLLLYNSYGEGIIEILDNFFLFEDNESEILDQVVINVSKGIADSNEALNEGALLEALKAREEKGSIVLTGYEAILIHCRTEAIEKLYFGAVKIGNEIKSINGKGELEDIKLGIIMLAPVGCDKTHIEVISYVSKMLIERMNFIWLLKTGDKDQAFEELDNIMKEFYRLKVMN